MNADILMGSSALLTITAPHSLYLSLDIKLRGLPDYTDCLAF